MKKMLKHSILSLLTLVLSGCIDAPLMDYTGDGIIRIVVFGDSNSEPGWQPFPNWCEKLSQQVPEDWDVICEAPYAKGGATAIKSGEPYRAYLDWQVTKALESGIEFDAAIFAYGTNDMIFPATTDDILDAYETVDERLGPRAVFIATTPFFRDGSYACRHFSLNLAIEDNYARFINFHYGIESTDYSDNVHMNESGHGKRAAAALQALQVAILSE